MAISEAQKIVLAQYTEGEQKFSYFLLGATGASLAFVVQKLDDGRFDLPGMVLFGAAALLLMSLLCGMRSLEKMNSARHSNVQLLQIQEGNHPHKPVNAMDKAIGLQVMSDGIDEASTSAGRLRRIQFFTLVLGVGFVVLWRAITMLINSATL